MRIDRNALLPLLAHAAECADKREGVTASVRLDVTDSSVTVWATDYDVTGSGTAPCDGGGDWSALVPATLMLRQIASLPDGATVTLTRRDSNRLLIEAGRSRYEVAGLDPSEFPEVAVPIPGGVALDSGEVRLLLNRAAYCVSQDDGRPAICGLYLEGKDDALRATATDGHRLATATCPAPGLAIDAIMHRRALSVLRKMLDGSPTVWLAAVGRDLVWRTRDLTLTCRRVEANFPDWRKVVPDTTGSPLRATFDAEAMLAELGRVAPVLPRGDAILRVTWVGPDCLELDGKGDLGDAHTELAADCAGEGVTIGLNPAFLRDACRALGGTVTVRATDGLLPVVLTSDAAVDCVSVLMPIRL